MSIEPITRKEMFMAKASGQNVNTPKPITREEKFLERIAENGGKATSWKDLGETTVMGDTLTWDGDVTGKVTTNIEGIMYVKISDVPPNEIDFSNGCAISYLEEGSPSSDSNVHVEVFEGNIHIDVNTVFVIFKENDDFPEKGIYFYYEPEWYITSLTINGYNGFPRTEITPLPNKYLDIVETVGSDTLTWDGDTEGLECTSEIFYRVSEIYPSLADAQNGASMSVCFGNSETVTIAATVVDFTESFGVEAYNISVEDGFAVLCLSQDCSVDGIIMKKGIYFMYSDDIYISSLKINGYTGFPKEQVKQKYLPSGGEKIAKICVDSSSREVLSSNITYEELRDALTNREPVIIHIYHIENDEYVWIEHHHMEIMKITPNDTVDIYYMRDRSSMIRFYPDGTIEAADIG